MADTDLEDESVIRDMEGMEIVKHDEFQPEDDDFEDDTGLTSAAADIVRSRYHVEGKPDWNAFHVSPPISIDYYVNHGHEAANDIYLSMVRPDPALAVVHRKAYRSAPQYEKVSGYDKKSSDRIEAAKRYGPRLADSAGGKGITSITRSVITQGVSMSGLLNITLATGCSAICNFCLESLTGHTYSESDISEGDSGIIRLTIDLDGETFVYEGPGKTKVAMWDPENEVVMYAPLQTAIMGEFPILKHSLKMISDNWGRMTRRNISD